MWNLLLASALCFGPVEVAVKTLDGDGATGALLELASDHVAIETAGETKRYDTKDLMQVAPATLPKGPVEPPVIRVELCDGSMLAAESFAVAKGTAAVALPDGERVEVPTRSIRAARFKRQDERLARRWREILDGEARGDVIVIRKPPSAADSPSGQEAVLNAVTGILGDVTAATVDFEFDRQRIAVPRQKVEGVVYYHAAHREPAELLCRVTDSAGSVWNVKSVELADDRLAMVTVCGVGRVLPFSGVRKLDFSSGNTVFLSDIEPVRAEWKPYLDSSKTQARAVRLFGYRRDRGFDAPQLTLGGQTYSKGLAIHSRTELVYRLPGAFRRLSAVAGIDDGVRPAGHVRLEILGDDKTLLDRVITGRDQPLPVRVDVSGVRRLKIVVDYGENIDVGDHLDLCNARITK